MKIHFFIILCFLFFFRSTVSSQTYFVDYDNGNDHLNGTTELTAWKHAPGDTNAAVNPADVNLMPGDLILFKGGVIYRGSIKVPAGGTLALPITYKGDGWGETKAIIDGGDVLTGWQQVESAAEAKGNPNWASMYYTIIPTPTNAAIVNLHEDHPDTGKTEFLWNSQTPNPPNPYFYDDMNSFYTIEQQYLTRTSIVDPDVFFQSDPDYWNNSQLIVWCNPNVVRIVEILDYIPAENKVVFEELHENAIYPDGRDQKYAIFNSIHAIDLPGEYYVNNQAEPDNTHKVYLWPRDTADLDERISYSIRKYGFDIAENDYVTIEGFEIRKHSADTIRLGGGIGTISGSHLQKTGIRVRNNLITHNRQAGNSYGVIFLSNAVDSVVENNDMIDNPKHKGIFGAGVVNTTIQNNEMVRPGSTSLSLYTSRQTRLIGNHISHSLGSHANGITMYLECEDILVANNVVLHSASPLTFQDSGNIYIINNVIDGDHNLSNVNEWGDTSHGPWVRGAIYFLNNTMTHNSRNSALNIGTADGIITPSSRKLRSLISDEDTRKRLLINLFQNGYIEKGVILSSFKNLTDASQLLLDAEFMPLQTEIFNVLKYESENNNYVVFNNIIDGGSSVVQVFDEAVQTNTYIPHPFYTRDYNIYTGLSWMQRPQYNWIKAPHETVDFVDGDHLIFVDPTGLNFRLLQTGPATDTGVDITPYLAEIKIKFPGFDGMKDIRGCKRKQGGGWDIGAYEYNANASLVPAMHLLLKDE